MSSLRTLAVVAVLGAIAYGVYLKVTGNSKNSPPPEAGWSTSGTNEIASAARVDLPAGLGAPGMPSGPGAVPNLPLPGANPGAISPPIGDPGVPPGLSAPSSITSPAPSADVSTSPVAPPSTLAMPTPVAVAPSWSTTPSGPSTPLAALSEAMNRSPNGTPSTAVTPPASAYPSMAMPDLSGAGAAASAPSGPASGSSTMTGSGGATPPAAAPPAGPNPAAPAPAASPVRNVVRENFAQLVRQVETMDETRWGEALRLLSAYYNHPDLTAEDTQRLTAMLDGLAAAVIYSRRYAMEQPYTVKPGDTLPAIGQAYQVPGELLAKINGIRDPQQLQPGRQLKVVRGPFDAVVDLNRGELILVVNQRYAGRFAINVGGDRAQLGEAYVVRDKKALPGASGPCRVLEVADPLNPQTRQLGICGPNAPAGAGQSGTPTNISLGDREIGDVYDILSVGSRVIIRR
jgi:hypothetical protein